MNYLGDKTKIIYIYIYIMARTIVIFSKQIEKFNLRVWHKYIFS